MALTVHQAGVAVGDHCWSEQRIFETLGAWVARTPDAAVKVVLDRHSAHAAWRAHQWADRLPVLAGLSPADLVAAADSRWNALFDAAQAADGSVARLAAAYRVLLPRLVGAYRVHREKTSDLADGPTRRTLAMVLDDVTADWVEGETLLQRHLADAAAVGVAAATVAALEALVVPASLPATSG